MPKGTKVHSCVEKLMKDGKDKGTAIAICQKSTGQNKFMSFKEYVKMRDSQS